MFRTYSPDLTLHLAVSSAAPGDGGDTYDSPIFHTYHLGEIVNADGGGYDVPEFASGREAPVQAAVR